MNYGTEIAVSFGREARGVFVRKEFCQAVLGVILIAGSGLFGAVHAEFGSKEREQKKEKVQLTVVEKKQSNTQDRNGETQKQRARDRRL